MTHVNTALDKANEKVAALYERLVNEEDARVCREISESACHYVPVNFFSHIAANTLTRLGDELASPKTVLAWVLAFVAAPVYLVGLLVPVRESGSMLPQLFIAAWVRRLAVRKWAWVIGSLLQAAAVAGIALVAFSLEGAVAGWSVIGLLVCFSLARGLCSVAHKDVIGKTIPKTRRGRLNGFSASLSGMLAIAVGLFFIGLGEGTAPVYATLLGGAALLWVAAAAQFSFIREEPGAIEGGGNAIAEAVARLGILKTDVTFRNFVIVRALLLCSALTAPYFVILAAQYSDLASASMLGLFIVANGLAGSLSAPFWGRMADASSKQVMVRAAWITGGLGLAMVLIVGFIPPWRDSAWLYPLAFFLLGIAHSGVRLGRKTYVLDLASGNRRTDYVAVSNTVIGVVLLAAGLVGLLAALISALGVVLVFSLLGITGAVLGTRLQEA